jgi:hypothetical protein
MMDTAQFSENYLFSGAGYISHDLLYVLTAMLIEQTCEHDIRK